METPLTVSVARAASISGLGQATIRRMCIENRIKHVRLTNGSSGRRTYLICYESLLNLLRPVPDTRPPKVHLATRGRPEKIIL